MGAILAMTPIRCRPLALLGLAVLAACGNAPDATVMAAIGGLASRITQPRAAPVDAKALLSPQVLAAADQPVMLAEIPARRAAASLIVAGTNGSHVTWVSGDGISLTLQSGLLTASRGLGYDLMSADVSQSLLLLQGNSGTAVRVHRYLDGENQITLRSFVCSASPAGAESVDLITRRVSARIVAENCASSGESFTNRYWIAGSGHIIKSEQWVGPETGMIRLLRVVD